MLTVTRATEAAMLGVVVARARTLHLYANDWTPTPGDGAADLHEVAGGGYAPVELVADDWTIAPGDAGSLATYPARSWTFSDGVGYVYGYYVAGADGEPIWAERFATRFLAANPGDRVSVALVFTLGPR